MVAVIVLNRMIPGLSSQSEGLLNSLIMKVEKKKKKESKINEVLTRQKFLTNSI